MLLIKGGWWVAWSIIGPTGPSAAQTKLNSLRKTIAQSTSGKTQSTSGHSNPLQKQHLAQSQITEITFLRNYHTVLESHRVNPTSSIADFKDQLSGQVDFWECLENLSKNCHLWINKHHFRIKSGSKGVISTSIGFPEICCFVKVKK